MKAGTKQRITKQAQKAFKEWDKNRTPIEIENSTEVFQAADDEEFRQCSEVKYWYVSNKSNVISFYNPSRPRYIQTFKDKSKRGRERFTHGKDNWMSYELVARTFDVYTFGKAKKGNAEAHHVRSFDYTKGREYNDDPEFLEWVLEYVHDFLTYIQGHPNEPTVKNMECLAHIAEKEAPGEAVIVTDGGKDYTAIFSMSNEEMLEIIKQSPDYERICNQYQIEKALANIINIVGYDYFVESKYILFAFPSYTYLYRISNVDAEIIKEDYTGKDIEEIIEPIVVEF